MWINLNTGHYVIDNVYYLIHNLLLLLLIFLTPKTDKNIDLNIDMEGSECHKDLRSLFGLATPYLPRQTPWKPL